MLSNIYNQTVTILNKRKQSDTNSNTDEWYKHMITNAVWYSRVERTVTGGNVYIGTYVRVLIPYNDLFLDYYNWKQLEDCTTKYTMSAGDYVVLGEVSETITPSNIVSVMNTYIPNVCKVKHVEILHDRYGAYVQLNIEGN